MKLHPIVSAVIIFISINAYSADTPAENQNNVEQISLEKQENADKDYENDNNVKIELELQEIMKECKLMFPACDN